MFLFVEFFDVGLGAAFDAVLSDDDFARLLGFRDVEHDVEHDILDDAFEGAGTSLAFDGFLGDSTQGIFLEFELDVVHRQQFLILLDGSVFGLGQDAQQRVFVEGFEGADDRQAADDFRDDAVLHEVFRTDLMDELIEFRLVVLALHLGTEADRGGFGQALADDFIDADKGTADDEQDVLGVDFDGRRLGMLALAAGSELDDVAFEHLQERLLDAFVARVGCDGVVGAGFTGNLIELVEVDDTVFGLLDVLVGGIVEVAHGDFYIGTDKAGLGEARSVRYGKRDVEELGQMREQCRLAAAGGAEHDNVGFLDFGAIVVLIAVLHAFIMVVDRDGEDLLGAVLVDDVFVKILLDDMWLVLGQDIVELAGEFLMLFLLGGGVVLVEEVIDLAHTVLADGKAGIRVIDRHIVLIMDFDRALAEAALMRDWLLRHMKRPF